MRRMTAMLLLAAVAAGMCSGCVGRLIGEGAEKTLGPKGVYWEEKPLAYSRKEKVLAPYTQFVLEPVKNSFGHNVPPEFFTLFPGEFRRAMMESRLPRDPAGKVLAVRVAVIHYETADKTDNVLGPLEQVVARVELVDKATGKVLAWGNAVGRTGKTVGLGAEWKAQGLAKAIVKWISAYYPRKAGEKDEDEEDET